MELIVGAASRELDMSYLESAIQTAHDEISARMGDQGRLVSKAVARLFRPGVDDGVVW
jgi:hypothetical protein